MENATNALMMAGSVLIALIVIGVLVLFFHNVSEWQAIEQSSEALEQAVEFNKQYDVYARNIYGSDLLSIANKVDDYNKKEADTKGYTRIELSLILREDIDKEYWKKGTYTASAIKSKMQELEEKIEELGNVSIKSAANRKNFKKGKPTCKYANERLRRFRL